ncbi:MAG: M48 family metallopeptidase [Planctomycetota bacterium]
MQFVLVLAILAALVISESAPSEPVSGPGYRLAVAALGMAFVATFALACSGWIAGRLRRDFQRRDVLLAAFKNLRRVHVVLWLSVAGGILYWLDWAQLVRVNWRLDRAILVDDVLILLPVLLPMVLSWAAFYEVDRVMQTGLESDDSRVVEHSTRRQYLMLHLRHYLGLLLAPVLALLAVQDAANLLVPGILEGPYAPAVYLPPILLVFLFFPTLLRRVWSTRPLTPGPLRNRLEAAARRAGFRARDILVWHTGHRVVNAAVAGFLAPLRYVFLTDGLLAQLDDEEVEAVFGHEIGHVRHHHLLLRVLAMIAPVSLGLLVHQAFPGALAGATDWLTSGRLGFEVPLGLLVLLGMALYVPLVFGVYSRCLEAQADLFGCRTLAFDRGSRPVETFTSALEKLAVAGGQDRRAPAWQHGSVARRVDLLNRAAKDARWERRLQRRVHWLSGLFLAAVLSPLVYGLLVG